MLSKKHWKFIVKLLISIAFVFWIVFKINWADVWTYLQKMSWCFVLIYLIVFIVGVIISGYKWKLLAEFKGLNNTLSNFFWFYLSGIFINNFMPSFIGGDTFRAYESGKQDKKYIEAASAVMMDRITGFVGTTVLIVVFSLINFKNVFHHPTLITLNVLILASFLIDIAMATIKSFSFWNTICEHLPAKLVSLIDELDEFSKNRKILWRAINWSMIFGLVGVGVANYVLFLGLDVHIGFLNYLSVIFLISIISALPISINNIGIKEWAYVTFFGFFGANPSQVITAAIMSRMLQMLMSFAALPTYLRSRENKKGA